MSSVLGIGLIDWMGWDGMGWDAIGLDGMRFVGQDGTGQQRTDLKFGDGDGPNLCRVKK